MLFLLYENELVSYLFVVNQFDLFGRTISDTSHLTLPTKYCLRHFRLLYTHCTPTSFFSVAFCPFVSIVAYSLFVRHIFFLTFFFFASLI